MYIKKLEGTHNFAVWKKQCYNILLQKKHSKPIKVKGVKPTDMDEDDWQELSTIELSNALLFNIEGLDCAYSIWTRLEELYAQKTATSKVYWLKKLMDLRMTEGTPMLTHLSEFNSIFS